MKLIVLFCFILSACFQDRLDYLQDDWGKVTFTDNHGIYVAGNGYAIDQQGFEEEMERVISLWELAMAGEGVNCNVREQTINLFISYTTFPFFDEHYMNGEKPVSGISYLREGVSRVGFSGSFERSALGHEYGHQILFRCIQDFSHEHMDILNQRYGIPY